LKKMGKQTILILIINQKVVNITLESVSDSNRSFCNNDFVKH